MAGTRFTRAERALLGMFFACYLGQAVRGIAGYWLEGHEGWTATQLAISAVNTVRFGPVATRFARTDFYTGAQPPSAPEDFWPTYSPLEGLLLAGVFRFVGPFEWAARSLYLLISAGTFWLVVRLCRRTADALTAICAAGVLAFLPAFISQGRFVTYDVPSLALTVLALTCALAGDQAANDRRRRWGLYAVTAGAVFWGYHIHFLVPVLVGYGLLVRFLAPAGDGLLVRRPMPAGDGLLVRRPMPAGLVPVWLGALALFVVQVAVLRGPAFLVDRLRRRTGVAESLVPSLEFVRQQLDWLPVHFTSVATALAAVGAVLALGRLLRGRPTPLDGVILVLLATGAGYLVVFKNLAAIHDYVQLCLVPFVAVAAAGAMAAMVRALGGLGHAHTWAVLVLLAATYVRQATALTTASHQAHRRGLADVEVARWVAPGVAPGERILHTLDVGEHLPPFHFYLRDGFRFVQESPMPAIRARRPTVEEFRTAMKDPTVRYAVLDPLTTDGDLLAHVLATSGVEEIRGRLVVDPRSPPRYTFARPVAPVVSPLWRYLVSDSYLPFVVAPGPDPDRLALLLDQAGIPRERFAGVLPVGEGPVNLLSNPTAALAFASWTPAENGGQGVWDFVVEAGRSAWVCRGFTGTFGHSAWNSDPIRVRAGATYALGGDVWTGGQTAGTAALRVDWYDPSDALVQESQPLAAPIGQPAWARLATTVTAPAQATHARVLFYVAAGPVTTDTRFRDLAFGLRRPAATGDPRTATGEAGAN